MTIRRIFKSNRENSSKKVSSVSIQTLPVYFKFTSGSGKDQILGIPNQSIKNGLNGSQPGKSVQNSPKNSKRLSQILTCDESGNVTHNVFEEMEIR